MVKVGPTLFVALLGVLAPFARADDALHKTTQVDTTYYRIEAKVGVEGSNAAAGRISGTNVNVTCSLNAFYKVDEPNPKTYTKIVVESGSLEIDGTELYQAEAPPGPTGARVEPEGRSDGDLVVSLTPAPQVTPGGGGPSPWTAYVPEKYLSACRFASTHFADGTAISIKVTGKFAFYTPDGTPGGHKDHVTEISAEVNPVTYNKLETLGTHVDASGATSSVFQAVSNATTAAAYDVLSNSHTVSPGETAQSEDKDTILYDRIPESTIVVAMTHGSPSDFWGSSGPPSISWQLELAQRILTCLLKYNLAAFWACETIDGDAPNAYLIPIVADQAYIGFEHDVHLGLWPADSWQSDQKTGIPTNSLNQHASAFWNYIVDGLTVGEAIIAANADYMPMYPVSGSGSTTTYRKSEMQLIGDSDTTLLYVYFSSSERSARILAGLSLTEWWVKI